MNTHLRQIMLLQFAIVVLVCVSKTVAMPDQYIMETTSRLPPYNSTLILPDETNMDVKVKTPSRENPTGHIDIVNVNLHSTTHTPPKESNKGERENGGQIQISDASDGSITDGNEEKKEIVTILNKSRNKGNHIIIVNDGYPGKVVIVNGHANGNGNSEEAV